MKSTKVRIRDPWQDNLLRAISYAISVLWLAILLFPLFWLAVGTMKDQLTAQQQPPAWLPKAPFDYRIQLNYDNLPTTTSSSQLEKAIKEDFEVASLRAFFQCSSYRMNKVNIEAYRHGIRIGEANMNGVAFSRNWNMIFISNDPAPKIILRNFEGFYQRNFMDWKIEIQNGLGARTSLGDTSPKEVAQVNSYMASLQLHGKVLGTGVQSDWTGWANNFVTAFDVNNRPDIATFFQQPSYGQSMLNSLFITFLEIVGQLLINAGAAYALSRLLKPKSIRFWLLFFLATMMIPGTCTLLPSYTLISSLGLISSPWAVVLPGLGQGFIIYLLKGFFDALPGDLFDASRIDGATEYRIMYNVVIPLSTSAFAVVVMWTFLGSWNNFFWPYLVLKAPNSYTFPIGLFILTNSGNSSTIGSQFTQGLLAAVPTLLIFGVFQRQIQQGLVWSGIKG